MDITGIAKSHHVKSTATGKASSRKEWKLSDSLREKVIKGRREEMSISERGVCEFRSP